MRKLVVLCIMTSVMCLCSVVSVFASDLPSPKQQELVIQMIAPCEVDLVFTPAHPAEALVPHGVPAVFSAGHSAKVEARCNSPGDQK